MFWTQIGWLPTEREELIKKQNHDSTQNVQDRPETKASDHAKNGKNQD
jgi:hypothetical protein